MANIVNLTLGIKKGTNKSTVTVTYDACFTKCELQDNTTFIETAKLRGDDPVNDDNLTTLKTSCVSATKACVKRKITRSIPNSVLNEDWGTDEVYAQVKLVPFKPRTSSARSNIISSRF